jgi:hypothetical protein
LRRTSNTPPCCSLVRQRQRERLKQHEFEK